MDEEDEHENDDTKEVTTNKQQKIPLLKLNKRDVQDVIRRLDTGYRPYYGPSKTNSIGCKLAQKQPNKGKDSGWVKCKLSGQKPEYYIHHLALIAADRSSELENIKEEKKQVSHLCHNRICYEHTHLVVEKAEMNLNRNKCHGWTWITCPCGCEYKFNPCTHQPQCILPQ